MPTYDIEHVCPLSSAQCDALASAITDIHAHMFCTPKYFVNVLFHDVANRNSYVGGKRRGSNIIVANVRHGPSRSRDKYRELCEEISGVWNDVVGGDGERQLRVVTVRGSIVAGWEVGMFLPEAGGDVKWAEEHREEFEDMIKDGNSDVKEMVEEMKSRDEFKKIWEA